MCVRELCWFYESALAFDQIHQSCQSLLLKSSDCESSRRWSPLRISTASQLYNFCIFDVEVTNSFGVCHNLTIDYVSHENLVDSQHFQDIDGCKWKCCHCFSSSATDKADGSKMYIRRNHKYVSTETTNIYLLKPILYILEVPPLLYQI